MPGVLAVVRDPRFLRNPAQGMAGAAPEQGPDELAYFGQPVALVVAESLETAYHAALASASRSRRPTPVLDPEAPGVELDRPEGKQQSQGDLDRAMTRGSAQRSTSPTARPATTARRWSRTPRSPSGRATG